MQKSRLSAVVEMDAIALLRTFCTLIKHARNARKSKNARFLMNMSLWQIISTTDLMSKGVLLLLLGMSVVCWAFALYKRMAIVAKLKQLRQAVMLLQNTKGMDDFLADASVMQHTFAGDLIAGFVTDFNRVQKLSEHSSTSSDAALSALENSVITRIDDVMAQEEAMIPLLSTSAQAAPLVGLFGTVWGLIHAFMVIAEQRSADISAVAPGIAEALVTTMGGLVVAIPALVLFNYLQGFIKQFESSVVDLANACLWIMKGALANQKALSDAPFMSQTTQPTSRRLL